MRDALKKAEAGAEAETLPEQQRSRFEPADGVAGDADGAASGTASGTGGVGGAASDAGSASGAASDADPKPRKPGPGRQRIGREPMVSLSTKLEPAVLQSIADAAAQANLSKSAVLRELAETGLKRVLVAGYEKVTASPNERS